MCAHIAVRIELLGAIWAFVLGLAGMQGHMILKKDRENHKHFSEP